MIRDTSQPTLMSPSTPSVPQRTHWLQRSLSPTSHTLWSWHNSINRDILLPTFTESTEAKMTKLPTFVTTLNLKDPKSSHETSSLSMQSVSETPTAFHLLHHCLMKLSGHYSFNQQYPIWVDGCQNWCDKTWNTPMSSKIQKDTISWNFQGTPNFLHQHFSYGLMGV